MSNFSYNTTQECIEAATELYAIESANYGYNPYTELEIYMLANELALTAINLPIEERHEYIHAEVVNALNAR